MEMKTSYITPRVSVVIASYRRETSLKNALESLANQTYTDYEIILVDDNAECTWNRRVSKIVEEFQQRHPDIHLTYIVNSFNKGSAATRNVAIQASRGEYITFLDDDDIYLPEKIANQVECMIRSEADYGVTDLELYYDNDRLCEKRTRTYIKKTDYASLIRYHMMYHIAGTDTIMFRREYLLQIGGFDSVDMGDEFYLILKAIERKGSFVYLHKCDVKAYVHREIGGLSSGDGKIEGENDLYAVKKKYYHFLSKKDIRYVETRHFAVIAFAELRRKHYAAFLKNALKAFAVSPIDCVRLLKEHR